MIEKLAGGMATFYVQNDYISVKERNSYKYGFEILLSTVCNIVLVLGIAALLNSFAGAVLYMAAFVAVRSAGGGYHAKSHQACVLIFSAVFAVICLFINRLDSNQSIAYGFICAMISSLILWRVAPVEAPNKPMSAAKRIRLEKMSLLAGSGFMALALIEYVIAWIPGDTAAFIFSGELAATVTMAVAAYKRRREDGNHAQINS